MRYTITVLLASAAAPAMAEPPSVVAGTPVVQSLVAQVMGETGTPEVLLDQGADPHSFQLRPTQAQALADADLVFWVGPELTPWLQRALDGVEGGGEVVTLLEAEGLHRQDFQHGRDHDHDDGHGHGHDDDHDDHDHGDDDHDSHDDHEHEDDHGHDEHGHDDGHDDHAHDDDHGHEHGDDEHGHDDHAHDDDHGHGDDHDHAHDGLDPHAWMNTGNAQVWINVIAARLSEHDPDNADTYAANAEAARARIDEIEADVAATLEPLADAPLIMFHDAYGYLSDQFGVNVAGNIALGDAAAPGAERIRELQATLAEAGAVCVFPEVNHSSRYVDVVVEGTGVHVGAELDPAGMMLDYGPELYGELMTQMAAQIAECVARD